MMESVKSIIHKVSVNHVLFVGLCAVVVYLFRARDTYYLKPVWRKRIESSSGDPWSQDSRLPAPVIADLESDGVNEIVLISNDMKLTILALPDMDNESDAILPHVIVKHKVTMPLMKAKGDASRPVVMKTGFLTPYRSMLQVRSQIIVIVTADWQVLCYNPNLQLLWHTTLMPNMTLTGDHIVKTMSVLITSHSVKKNDEGLVIIGGSMTHKKHQDDTLDIDHFSNHSVVTYDIAHFSTFALSGRNGSIRWHHLPGDFGEQPQDIKAGNSNSTRQDEGFEHHWKLGLRKNRLHKGEVPWRFYKENIRAILPHQWSSLEDTRFKLARFQREIQLPEANTDEEQEMEGGEATALKPEHIVGYAYGGQRPHSHDEHVDNPNAIVIHRDNGIEVLNLLSGRPKTRLEFLPDSSVYLDVDGDSEPERITWGQFKDHTVCYLDIWRQEPIREKLDQLSVCISKRMVWTRSWALDEDFYKKIPPYITHSVAKKKGIISHLMGRHLSSDVNYDIISVTSLGRVSSFDMEGNIHWQAQTQASWAHQAADARRDRKRVHTSTKEFFNSFMPSRVPMSVKVFGPEDAIAIGGFTSIAMVDLLEGSILAEHSIPAPPTAPLVIGDFNNDGVNDLILTCKMGYIGFIIQSQTNHQYTAMYAVAVFISIFLVTLCMSPEVWAKSEEEDD